LFKRFDIIIVIATDIALISMSFLNNNEIKTIPLLIRAIRVGKIVKYVTLNYNFLRMKCDREIIALCTSHILFFFFNTKSPSNVLSLSALGRTSYFNLIIFYYFFKKKF